MNDVEPVPLKNEHKRIIIEDFVALKPSTETLTEFVKKPYKSKRRGKKYEAPIEDHEQDVKTIR